MSSFITMEIVQLNALRDGGFTPAGISYIKEDCYWWVSAKRLEAVLVSFESDENDFIQHRVSIPRQQLCSPATMATLCDDALETYLEPEGDDWDDAEEGFKMDMHALNQHAGRS